MKLLFILKRGLDSFTSYKQLIMNIKRSYINNEEQAYKFGIVQQHKLNYQEWIL